MANEVKVHDPTLQVTVGSISVALDPVADQVMVASQANGVSGTYSEDLVSGVSPAWVTDAFGFTTQGILLQNESDELIQVSFDGANVSFELEPANSGGSIKALDNIHFTNIHVRSASGGKTIHVEAW